MCEMYVDISLFPNVVDTDDEIFLMSIVAKIYATFTTRRYLRLLAKHILGKIFLRVERFLHSTTSP